MNEFKKIQEYSVLTSCDGPATVVDSFSFVFTICNAETIELRKSGMEKEKNVMHEI